MDAIAKMLLPAAFAMVVGCGGSCGNRWARGYLSVELMQLHKRCPDLFIQALALSFLKAMSMSSRLAACRMMLGKKGRRSAT